MSFSFASIYLSIGDWAILMQFLVFLFFPFQGQILGAREADESSSYFHMPLKVAGGTGRKKTHERSLQMTDPDLRHLTTLIYAG